MFLLFHRGISGFILVCWGCSSGVAKTHQHINFINLSYMKMSQLPYKHSKHAPIETVFFFAGRNFNLLTPKSETHPWHTQVLALRQSIFSTNSIHNIPSPTNACWSSQSGVLNHTFFPLHLWPFFNLRGTTMIPNKMKFTQRFRNSWSSSFEDLRTDFHHKDAYWGGPMEVIVTIVSKLVDL